MDKGKPTRIATVALLMLFLLLFVFPQEASAESRIALVIGNGAYGAEGRLKAPANDARLTADTLRSLDFELYGGQAHVNLSEKKMRRLIHDFSEELGRRAKPVGLFYYSGHGLQFGGRNYMIPVDADIRHEVDVESEGISIDVDVLGRMNLARTKINIIILDACRINPFEKRIKALGRRKGLSDMRPEQGSIIAFAAEPGEVAYESGGQYSHFTEVLAGEMKVPGIEILKMFQRVRVAVNRRTNGEQTPVERNVLFEDFFFKPLNSSISGTGKKDEGAEARKQAEAEFPDSTGTGGSPPQTPVSSSESDQAKEALSVLVEFWAETIDRASTQEDRANERAAFREKFSNSSSLPLDIKELWLDEMLEQRKFLGESEFMAQFMDATDNPQLLCEGLVWLSRKSFEDFFPEDADRSEYRELPIYDSIAYTDFQASNRRTLSEEDKGALVHYTHEHVLSECMGLLLKKWKETESHHDRQPIISRAKEIARRTLPAKLADSWVEHIFTEGEYVAPVWFAGKVAEGGEGMELALIAIKWLRDQAHGSRAK